MYVPDYLKQGKITTIKSIPNPNGAPGYFWKETESCAGFNVSNDCPWRFEEMELIGYTPNECLQNIGHLEGCDQMVAYIRIQSQIDSQEEAMMQFYTTIFTCVVLSIASVTVSGDIEVIVIQPIKKIVDIIQRLAESPLKKPEPPAK